MGGGVRRRWEMRISNMQNRFLAPKWSNFIVVLVKIVQIGRTSAIHPYIRIGVHVRMKGSMHGQVQSHAGNIQTPNNTQSSVKVSMTQCAK